MHKDQYIQDFLDALDSQGVRPVRHGRWIGLQGRNLNHLPPAIWHALAACRDHLVNLLPDEPTPFQSFTKRKGRVRAPTSSQNN
jgi:hypothetical protein